MLSLISVCLCVDTHTHTTHTMRNRKREWEKRESNEKNISTLLARKLVRLVSKTINETHINFHMFP